MWLSAANEASRLTAMNAKPRLYQRLAFNLIVAVVIGVCFGARQGVAQEPSVVGLWEPLTISLIFQSIRIHCPRVR